MKFVEDGAINVLELTERNLRVLLTKLKDPYSARTLIDPSGRILVRAVPDSEHYSTRPAGEMAHEPITDEELNN